jgi:hypothetical protein
MTVFSALACGALQRAGVWQKDALSRARCKHGVGDAGGGIDHTPARAQLRSRLAQQSCAAELRSRTPSRESTAPRRWRERCKAERRKV